MAITKTQIARINELARKKKTTEGLTPAEQNEQNELRRLYINSFKDNLRAQLETVKLVDDEGNDITPDKLKKVQKDKGLR